MLKYFQEHNRSIYHPSVDRQTDIGVVCNDGRIHLFTILDAATTWDKDGTPLTVALLENNKVGDEWCMVVRLPKRLIHYHQEQLRPEDKESTGVLILNKDIVVCEAYNSLLEEMADEMPDYNFELWTDAEVDD